MVAQGPPVGTMPRQRTYPHGPQIHRVPEVIDRRPAELRNGAFRRQPQERRDGVGQYLERAQGRPPARDELVDVAKEDGAPGMFMPRKDTGQPAQEGEVILPPAPVLASCSDVGPRPWHAHPDHAQRPQLRLGRARDEAPGRKAPVAQIVDAGPWLPAPEQHLPPPLLQRIPIVGPGTDQVPVGQEVRMPRSGRRHREHVARRCPRLPGRRVAAPPGDVPEHDPDRRRITSLFLHHAAGRLPPGWHTGPTCRSAGSAIPRASCAYRAMPSGTRAGRRGR